jgi:hypothetical protein
MIRSLGTGLEMKLRNGQRIIVGYLLVGAMLYGCIVGGLMSSTASFKRSRQKSSSWSNAL